MSSTPPSRHPQPTTRQVRRRPFAIAVGLLAPVPLIWFAAATIVAHGLRFPPALAYSTNGPSLPGKPAASDRALHELLDSPSEEIDLRQSDHRAVHGLLAPPGPAQAVVVLVYPNRVYAQAMVGYFRAIRSAGYAVLIIEDASPVPEFGFGWTQRRDVLAAVAALRARRVQRIGLLGVSEGAAAALFAASEAAPIAAIISDSSYAELSTLMRRIPPLDSLNPLFDRTVLWEVGWMAGQRIEEIAPAKAAAKLRGRPLMVINGADDPLVPPADARRIFAAAGGPGELWIVSGAGHAAALSTDPEQYARRVSAFLARYLGAPVPGARVN